MNIEELKTRIIKRSRDGLVEYSVIRKNSIMIIDLYELQKYFLIDNILEELLTQGKIILESNQVNLIKTLKDLDSKLNIANKNASEESQNEIRNLETKIKRLNRLQLQYEQEVLNMPKLITFPEWLRSKQEFIKAKLEK